jgi:outer membrane protein TolC
LKPKKANAKPMLSAIFVAIVLSTSSESRAQSSSYEVYQKSPVHEIARMLINEVESPQTKPPFNTLKRDINAVFNSVPAVLASRDALNAIDAQREQAYAGYLPKVTLSAGAGGTDQVQTTTTSKGSTNSYTFNVSQHLYDFGTTNSSYDAATARYEAGKSFVYTQRNETLLKLLTSTLDVQRTKKNLVFGRGYVDTRREFLSWIKERESLKVASSLDVIRAELKLAEAIDDMTSLARQVDSSNAAYKELFGQLPKFKETGFQLPSVRLESLGESSGKVGSLRAFQEQESKLIAAKREYDAARGKLYGAIVLDATASRTDNPSGLRATEVSTVQILYRVDLFSGFAQSGRAKELAAKQMEASFEKDRAQRELLKRLENARANLQASQESLKARLLLLKRSQATDLATRELFVLGKATLTDTFKAQEDYFSAAQKLVNAEFDYNVAYYTVLSVNEQLLEQFDLAI